MVFSLNWLLVLVPIAVALKWAGFSDVAVFFTAGVAIVPLAGLMGHATEALAERLGPGIGGLLNATFGNAAELIIAVMVLRRAALEPERADQYFELVKASLTGSIIGNILLVLGLSILAGGLFHRRQTFNATAAGLGATLLALASIGLIMPTIYFYLMRGEGHLAAEDRNLTHLSEEIAVVLATVYALSLVFSLLTHKHLFGGDETAERHAHGEASNHWSPTTAVFVLIAATVGVAIMSELLAGAVEKAGHTLGMNEVFIGVIVVAIVGNAAEHSTAVLVAMKNQMDLAINIAIGSSIQIALFVAPALVLASVLLGTPRVLDLHFTAMEVICIVLSVGVLSMVAQDGECHWMEGVMLLAVYIIFALAFFHLPSSSHGM